MDNSQSNELKHYNIKGSHWGIRRWQNPDGSLTEAGRLRYNKGAEDVTKLEKVTDKNGNVRYNYIDKDGNKKQYKKYVDDLSPEELADLMKNVKLENSYKSEKDSEANAFIREYKESYSKTASNAQSILSETNKLVNSTASALPKGNGKTIKKDYSNISDKDLRDRINRIKLEDEYGRLTGETKYVKSGSEKAREILQTTGSVLAVGTSAAILTKLILDMKGEAVGKSELAKLKHSDDNEYALQHHGIKGQHWGERRFQNPDGSLTPEGQRRYRTNLGTKEMIKNTSSYDKLTKSQQKQYVDYGKKSGAKKGFLVGMGVGATAGIAKTAADYALTPSKMRKHSVKKVFNIKDDSVNTNSIGSRFIRNAILGAFGGATLGTFLGSRIGKKNAEAKLAAHGKEYVDEILNEPVERLRKK